MASIIPGYEYDIFISYRQKNNKGEQVDEVGLLGLGRRNLNNEGIKNCCRVV